MALIRLSVLCSLCAVIMGCPDSPAPPAAPVTQAPSADTPAGIAGEAEVPSAVRTPSETTSAAPDEHDHAAAAEGGTAELKLEGISFLVPVGWKKVKPDSRIIEAEFELPRAADDEFDGRLTLMSSGGDREEVIATRIGEFKQDPGTAPGRETITIGTHEAILVDIRGEWRGSNFRPLSPPRADYRMVLLIIPFTERSSFYAKLTGPRETIAAHEDEFREFVRSARIQHEKQTP